MWVVSKVPRWAESWVEKLAVHSVVSRVAWLAVEWVALWAVELAACWAGL